MEQGAQSDLESHGVLYLAHLVDAAVTICCSFSRAQVSSKGLSVIMAAVVPNPVLDAERARKVQEDSDFLDNLANAAAEAVSGHNFRF